MALRINLEIGHEASLRTKRTPEGFTHDWKIFVRGSDNADIQYYVEKVVFYLHDTFQKPKRVVKEPPYVVKESGYAGFNLPIEIYLKNSGEPKKIKFNYDLNLQNSGPPVNKVQKEKYIFTSPPEDFRQKLLRGGAVTTSGSQELNENKLISHEEKNQLLSKPKFGGSTDVLQKKKMEPQVSNSFQELFGPPITKTSRISETKAPSGKDSKIAVKTEKEKDKVKKHSPHKDRDKGRDRDKSEKKSKEDKKKDKEKRDRDGEKAREKSLKREKSPRPHSPSPRHPSPKPISPPPPTSQSTSKHREKDVKVDKEKKEKPEKDEKRSKKEKKEKEYNRDKHKDINKVDHKSKEVKNKETLIPSVKETEIATTSTSIPLNPSKLEKKEKLNNEEKNKLDRIEKVDDKKHKHKKKDKNKKDRKEKDEKSHKIPKKNERDKSMPSSNPINGNEVSERNNLFGNSPKTEPNSVSSSPKDKTSKPLNKLFSTFLEEDSGSSPSSREPSPVQDSRKKEKQKKSDKKNTEKDSDRKKKRKAFAELEQPPEKVVKEEENNSDTETNVKQELTGSTKNSNTEAEDYMSILRSLQHKIMALKDNADLQKVVQLIAETGQYEISAHTFDFDLCLLDRSTVKQLQDFLSTTS